MKKTYDWSVRLWVLITNSHRKIEVVTSIHTNIHQLKIQIAKILDLPILDTHIELYFRGDRPLKPTSTLLQNDIENHVQLTATITRTKTSPLLPIDSSQKQTSHSQSSKVHKKPLT